jgi:hypothetical protein
MIIILPDSVCSRQDLKSVVLEIRAYAKWYNQTSVKMRVSGDNNYEEPVFSPSAAAIIGEWNKQNPINPKSIDDLISELENMEAKAPIVSITLAAPPPGNLKKTITKWCRENVAPDVLVDFAFNSTMLGGMVVRVGSHVYDWSFRRQILSSLQKFPEVLRNV